jgi:hypothetical protein
MNVSLAQREQLMIPDDQITLTLRDRSITGKEFDYSRVLAPGREVGPILAGGSPLEKIAEATQRVTNTSN